MSSNGLQSVSLALRNTRRLLWKSDFNWELRRIYFDLVWAYKIIVGQADIRADDFFELLTTITTRGIPTSSLNASVCVGLLLGPHLLLGIDCLMTLLILPRDVILARYSPHSTTPTPTSSRECRRVVLLATGITSRNRASDVSARILTRMSVSVSWNAGLYAVVVCLCVWRMTHNAAR